MATLVEHHTLSTPFAEKPRKSARIKQLQQKINPGRVVALLEDMFGILREEPSFEDRKLFQKIVKLFPRQRLIEPEPEFDRDEVKVVKELAKKRKQLNDISEKNVVGSKFSKSKIANKKNKLKQKFKKNRSDVNGR